MNVLRLSGEMSPSPRRRAPLTGLAALATLATLLGSGTAVALPPPTSAFGGPSPAADSSAPVATPPATPTEAALPTFGSSAASLREIGRVRATTTFCATLRDSTVAAADAALTFQNASLVTVLDIVELGHAENALVKHRLERHVEDEVRALTDLSRAGGAELAHLQPLAATSSPDERKVLLDLRNSLDGAKSRQHRLAKKIAELAGAAAAAPPTGSLDVATQNYLGSLRNGDGIALGSEDRVRALLPDNDDEEIRRDLATAATDVRTAVDLGACARPGDE